MCVAPSKLYFLSLLLLVSCVTVQTKEKNTVIATINVGVNPSGMAITPDNRFGYVANNNNYGLPNGDSVSVLDLKRNLLIQTINHSSFNEPYTVTINKAGTRAYVTNSNSTTITIIDIKTNTVVDVINGFDGPSDMVIHPTQNRAYVNNYGGPEGLQSGNGRTVRIVDLATNAIVGPPIVVGLAPAALAISPDGRYVYTINYVDGNPGTGTMSVIQTSTNTVVRTVAGFSGPFDIALTPDGRYAYVTNFGSNNFAPIGTTVSVVDLRTYTIVDTIDLGIQPSGIAVSSKSKYAYATNYNTLYAGSNFTNLTAGQGTVNIIDTESNEVIPPTIAVGQSPHGIVISPNGKRAYVAHYTSNTVDVIKIPRS